jgi:hypothetical protein
MLLDLRLLIDTASTSTGAPVVVASRPSGDEMYAIHRLKALAAMADEEAALALYLDGSIGLGEMLRIVNKPN